jgi:hypothetical protein
MTPIVPATESGAPAAGGRATAVPVVARDFTKLQAFLVGCMIAAIHTIAVLLFSPKQTAVQAYLDLATHYDSNWFANILENGYQATLPLQPGVLGNIVFPPGYPILAVIVQSTFNSTSQLALLIVSQASSAIFWMYVALFLRRWRTPFWGFLAVFLLLFTFPSAFYLVLAYSDSVFLASLLGYLYWIQDDRAHWGLIALHGFCMGATNLFALPLAILPFLWRRLSPFRALVVTLLTFAGAALFLGFCALRFGEWNLPFVAREVAWGYQHDFLNVLHPAIYRLGWPSGEYFSLILNSNTAPVVTLLLLTMVLLEVMHRKQPDSGRKVRILFLIAATLLWYLFLSTGITGVADGKIFMPTMLRLLFPVVVLLLLTAVHFLVQVIPAWRSRFPRVVRYGSWVFAVMIAGVILLSLLTQYALVVQFLLDHWAAG